MDITVDALLTVRAQPMASRRRAAALLISSLLHVLLVLGLLLAPIIRGAQREPLEFVAVQVVPVQALGVPAPRPEPPREAPPPRPAPPAPAPEAKPAAPSPEPRPQTPPRERTGAATGEEAPPRQRQGTPQGSPVGFSSFGAEVSALDVPNFGYNYYLEQMLAMIGGNWVRPPVPTGVQAEVVFRVMRDGRVEEIELAKSSGHAGFDLAAVRAVRLASPLPPLPQSYREDSLRVRLVVR